MGDPFRFRFLYLGSVFVGAGAGAATSGNTVSGCLDKERSEGLRNIWGWGRLF